MKSSSIIDIVQTVFFPTTCIRSGYAQAHLLRAGAVRNANIAPESTYLLTSAYLAQGGS